MMQSFKGSIRYRIFLLIFLSILPSIFFTVYAELSNRHSGIWLILLIVVSCLAVGWLSTDLLILRDVNRLIELAKRLSAGDLAARKILGNHKGAFDELARSFGQLAAILEERTIQLQIRTGQLAALRDITDEVSIQQDIDALIDLVVEMVAALLATSQASITLYDSSHNDLVISVVKGYPLPIGTRILMGEGAAGRAAQTRQTVIINDYQSWEGRLKKSENYPFSSVMQAPMVYRGELIGVLGVAEVEPVRRKFNQTDADLLSLFAGIVASGVRYSRLFEETRRQLRELETINEITTVLRVTQNNDEILHLLLEKTMNLVGAIMGSIWLYDVSDNSLHPIVSDGIPNLGSQPYPGEGVAGTIFQSGEPYFTSDWREDPLTPISLRQQIPAGVSGAMIPLRTAQGMVGVMTIGFHSPMQLTKEQEHLVVTLAEIAGNAIHSMQLREKTHSQLQRLSALHQIDLSITNSLDLEATLQVLLDQVINQLKVDAACVLIFNPHEQIFEFVTSRGFMTEALRYTRLHFGEGYAGRAALEQRTIHISDLREHRTDFLRSPSFSAEGFVTYYAVPLMAKGQVNGVLEIFHRSRLESDPEWLDFLKALASQAAIAIENVSLFNDLQRSNIELNLAYNSTIEGWSRALDLRDRETTGHSRRVTELTLRLARAMSVDEAELAHIRRGALLHDIGKLGIPDSILLKAGPLSNDETEIIRKHPEIAHEMLAPIAYLHPALEIPYCHHEKWDGSGYPRGLKGEQIPLSARIFAVVDVWDALISDRPYRKRWTEEKARAYLQEQIGKHFDPQVVEAFFKLLNEEKKGNQTSGEE